MYSSVALSTFTTLYSHHIYLVLNIVIAPKQNLIPINQSLPTLAPPVLATPICILPLDLPILDMAQK